MDRLTQSPLPMLGRQNRFAPYSCGDPVRDRVAEFRKPFTPVLGLPIAPLKKPHLEGTGALYFRLGKDDKRVALLTAAHVARPPTTLPNNGLVHMRPSHCDVRRLLPSAPRHTVTLQTL